ncbi:MAG: MarR family transcriptional regulator [Novosphingobium sp.]
MAELGVTRSQWTVIAVVSRSPGATQRSIAHTLEISEASAGRLVDRLCADGLLVRRPKDDDRRAYCVDLTDAGTALTSQLAEIARMNEETALADIPDDQLERLTILLDKIAANLGRP